jgi:hypothetical protein
MPFISDNIIQDIIRIAAVRCGTAAIGVIADNWKFRGMPGGSNLGR